MDKDDAARINADIETTIQQRRRQEQERLAKEEKERFEAARAVFKRAAANPDGRELLQYVHQLCGARSLSVYANRETGEMNPLTTIFHEGRRSIWTELSPHFDRETLIAIEYPEVRK